MNHHCIYKIIHVLNFKIVTFPCCQVDSPNPTACWKEIYDRIRNNRRSNDLYAEGHDFQRPGSEMFGFKNPKIAQLIQVYNLIFVWESFTLMFMVLSVSNVLIFISLVLAHDPQ